MTWNTSVSNASPEQGQYNMGIERVGTLAGRYQVYRDPYFPPNTILLGHKGSTSYRDWETDRKSTRLNSSHSRASRMPSSA